MLFSFAFVVYVARFLGVEGFGKYALAQRYFDLFLSLSATALSILMTREIARQPAMLNGYLNASLVLATGLTLIANAILVAMAWTFAYAADTQMALYWTALALLPAALSLILEAVFIAGEQAEYVTYGAIIESVVRVGLSLALLLMGGGLLALMVALLVARVVMLAFYLAFLNRKIAGLHWRYDGPFIGRVFREWRVFALENWLATLYGALDVILLSAFSGAYAVGIYVAAQKILRLGTIIAASYTTAIFSVLSRLFLESKSAFHQVGERTLKYMLIVVLPAVVTLSLLADRMIVLLYTTDYAAAGPVLRVLAWILLFGFLNPFLSHVLFAGGEQRKSLHVAIIKLVVFVVAGLWWIPAYGGVGVAWAGLVSAAVAFGFYFAFYFVFTGGRNDLVQTLNTLGKPTLAVLPLAALLLAWPESQLVPLLSAGGLLYVLALFLLRVLSMNELKLLQRVK